MHTVATVRTFSVVLWRWCALCPKQSSRQNHSKYRRIIVVVVTVVTTAISRYSYVRLSYAPLETRAIKFICKTATTFGIIVIIKAYTIRTTTTTTTTTTISFQKCGCQGIGNIGTDTHRYGRDMSDRVGHRTRCVQSRSTIFFPVPWEDAGKVVDGNGQTDPGPSRP